MESIESIISKHPNMKIVVERKGSVLNISGMWAKVGAPVGTGSAWMSDLTSWADRNNITLSLETGSEIDIPPLGYKETTSQNRLIRFYKQFGFKGSDIMHRTPAVNETILPKLTALLESINNIIFEADRLGRNYRQTVNSFKDELNQHKDLTPKQISSLLKVAEEKAELENEKSPTVFHMISSERFRNKGVDISEIPKFFKSNNEISVSVNSVPWDFSNNIVLIGETSDLLELYDVDVYTSVILHTGEKYPLGLNRKKGDHRWDEGIVKASNVEWSDIYLPDSYDISGETIKIKDLLEDELELSLIWDLEPYLTTDDQLEFLDTVEDIQNVSSKIKDLGYYIDSDQNGNLVKDKDLREDLRDLAMDEYSQTEYSSYAEESDIKPEFGSLQDLLGEIQGVWEELKSSVFDYIDGLEDLYLEGLGYSDQKVIDDIWAIVS